MADEPKVVEYHKLSLESYQKLEASMQSHIGVNDDTSAIAAGFMLGVQAVLKALRKGWVIGA